MCKNWLHRTDVKIMTNFYNQLPSMSSAHLWEAALCIPEPPWLVDGLRESSANEKNSSPGHTDCQKSPPATGRTAKMTLKGQNKTAWNNGPNCVSLPFSQGCFIIFVETITHFFSALNCQDVFEPLSPFKLWALWKTLYSTKAFGSVLIF